MNGKQFTDNDAFQRRFLDSSISTTDGQAATGGKKIRGYAAVFNAETTLFPGMREKIAPGAFADTIRNDDIRGLINHDQNFVLGRLKAGTLALREDNKGLWYEITPPDTQAARDLLVSIQRGDITGSSFGFFIVDKTMDRRGEDTIRTIRKATLLDVSVVTFPAYPQTEGVTARYTMNPQSITDDELFAKMAALEASMTADRPALLRSIRRARLAEARRILDAPRSGDEDETDLLMRRYEVMRILDAPLPKL